MVLPLVVAGIGAGAALIGAVAQAINSAKTTRAEKKANDQTTEAENAEIQRLEQLASQIERPDFSVEEINPALIDTVFKYSPESIPFVAEENPTIVEKSPVAQQSHQAQMGALGRFEELAQTGEDAQLIAAREGAEREQMQALSRAQAERDAMSQRRGLGMGSGAQLALGQADLTASAQTQQMMTEQAAADAALRRMQATQQAASLGGQITGQELALTGQNVDIINAFNQRQAMRQQDVMGQNVDTRNQAQLLASQNAQDVAQQNAIIQNQMAQQNRTAQMQAAQQQWGADRDIYGAQADVIGTRLDQAGRQGQREVQGIGRRAERTGRTISGISQAVGGAASGVGGFLGGGS